MPEKILLVDDDPDTLRLVGVMLQRQGYEVQVANSGKQALGMVQADLPDLILLDIMMPEMDGYDVARHLRSDPATADVPIIMFTAKSQVDDKVMGFEAGADDYLTKPTQPRELFAHIKAVLARTGKSQEGSSAEAAKRGYMIGVLAAKGGLGVSTLALNLGVTLHDGFKKDVIVADFRPGQGTLILEIGVETSGGFSNLLKCKPADISSRKVEAELVSHPSGVRFLLSSPQPEDARYLNASANFEKIAKHLLQLASYIILDLGPSLTPVTDAVVKHCQELILIVEPVPQNVVQTRRMIADLTNGGFADKKITPVLINRIRSGVHLSWTQVQEQLGSAIAVIFTPAPELAYQASTNTTPIVKHQPDSLSAQQYTKLAERIVKYSR
jgi:pilus assembly protein CpaE